CSNDRLLLNPLLIWSSSLQIMLLGPYNRFISLYASRNEFSIEYPAFWLADTELTASLNFNNVLARVYFDYALPGSNLNYSKFYIDDSADELNFKNANTIGLAIGYLTPKVKFQIVNLTQCMFELNIKAGDLPNKFTTEPYGAVDAFFAEYQAKLVALNKELDPTKATIIMADTTNETAITLLNNLVRLYNVQSSITNDAEMYLTAFATIQYLKVKNDFINATVTEKMCLDIIENYNSIINDYQTVLTDLVTFIAEL
ncbi:MAG: hypothetical protein MJ149_00655, partial [Clostridia bacterium]|nr:hypothetical protein [Clostridia bacterium]